MSKQDQAIHQPYVAFPSYPAPIPHPSIFPNQIQKRQNQSGVLTKTSSFISGRSFRGEAKEKK
jgi:hypothetical protein